MFSSASICIASAESEPLRLWRGESDLAARRQAALDKASTAAQLAGEAFLDAEAPEEVASGSADEVARARADADVLAAGITALRRRRQAALESKVSAKCDDMRAEIHRKEGELADINARREALTAKIAEIEGAPMAVSAGNVNVMPRSRALAADILGLQTQLAAIERAAAKISGEIQGSSITDLLARVEAAAASSMVPSAHDVTEWFLGVAARVAADRPELLRGHLEIPLQVVTTLPNGRYIFPHGAKEPPVGVRQTGPAALVAYRMQVIIAFNAGVIDTEKSGIVFPETANYPEHGPKTYRAKPPESARS